MQQIFLQKVLGNKFSQAMSLSYSISCVYFSLQCGTFFGLIFRFSGAAEFQYCLASLLFRPDTETSKEEGSTDISNNLLWIRVSGKFENTSQVIG